MDKIGLFPLGMVIFPGSSIPLHIFEARYKSLVNVAFSEQRAFGINLVDSSRLCQVGCTAVVSKIMQRYSDGRLDIAVTGIQRYRLQNLYDNEEPYYTGLVEYFEDIPEETDDRLRDECIDLFNELVGIAYPLVINDYILDKYAPPETASFDIAQKAGLDLLKRQELLEMRSENARLKVLFEYLEATLPQLRERKRIQDIVINDGYLPRKDIGL